MTFPVQPVNTSGLAMLPACPKVRETRTMEITSVNAPGLAMLLACPEIAGSAPGAVNFRSEKGR